MGQIQEGRVNSQTPYAKTLRPIGYKEIIKILESTEHEQANSIS